MILILTCGQSATIFARPVRTAQRSTTRVGSRGRIARPGVPLRAPAIMTSLQQATTKVAKGHEGNALYGSSPSCASGPWWFSRCAGDIGAVTTKDMRFIIYRQTGGIHSALRSHQGTHRQCALWFFPFVRFGSLVVKPSMTSLQQATTKVTEGHEGNALYGSSPSCASGPWRFSRCAVDSSMVVADVFRQPLVRPATEVAGYGCQARLRGLHQAMPVSFLKHHYGPKWSK